MPDDPEYEAYRARRLKQEAYRRRYEAERGRGRLIPFFGMPNMRVEATARVVWSTAAVADGLVEKGIGAIHRARPRRGGCIYALIGAPLVLIALLALAVAKLLVWASWFVVWIVFFMIAVLAESRHRRRRRSGRS